MWHLHKVFIKNFIYVSKKMFFLSLLFFHSLTMCAWSVTQNNWVPRRGDQGPKTIDQIHKEAELEEHREQIKVQQQLLSKKDSSQGRGGRGGPHSSGGRGSQTQDEGWNIVPISTKNRPIDTSRLSKITKVNRCDSFLFYNIRHL